MRDEKPTLKELLRSQKNLPAMDIEPIKRVFGDDAVPNGIDESQVGRLKLHHALASKFGPTYMDHPGVKEAVKHYENESKFLTFYKRTLGARYGR